MAIFDNGFEEGDFSAWTGTTVAPVVVHVPVHHDLHAAKCINNGESVYKDFASVNEIYARLYFQYTDNPAVGETRYVFDCMNTLRDFICRVMIRNVGGVMKWVISDELLGEFVSGSSPVPDTWYCVEVWWCRNTDAGMKLWVDGVEEAVAVGVTANWGGANRFRVVKWGTDGDFVESNYYDCCVVDVARISCEGGAPSAAGVSGFGGGGRHHGGDKRYKDARVIDGWKVRNPSG